MNYLVCFGMTDDVDLHVQVLPVARRGHALLSSDYFVSILDVPLPGRGQRHSPYNLLLQDPDLIGAASAVTGIERSHPINRPKPRCFPNDGYDQALPPCLAELKCTKTSISLDRRNGLEVALFCDPLAGSTPLDSVVCMQDSPTWG